MLYRLLIFGFCLVSSFPTSGQQPLSVAAGINLNYISLGDLPAGFNLPQLLEMRVGFHVGFSRSITLGEKIKLSPGLQYSQKGCAAVFLHYVELPVLISWSPIERFSIDAGPTLAYNIGAYEKYGDIKYEIKANKFDFGINAGASFKVLSRASIYGRYYYGVISFEEIPWRDENNVTYHRTPQYNKTIQFGVRYHFGKSTRQGS